MSMSKMGLAQPTQLQLAGIEDARKQEYQRRRGPRVRQLTPNAVKVLEHLEKAGSITNLEAITVLKVMSVSRRITELCDAGFGIRKEHKTDTTGTRYVKYWLEV